MKHIEKPSLDELFNSKKLDVPSDEFWDSFQDRVHERALTSVVQSTPFSLASKRVIWSLPLSLVCFVAVFLYFTYPFSSSNTPAVANNTKDIQTAPVEVLLANDPLVGDFEVVSPFVVDPKLSDQSLYVHNSMEWIDEESSFEEPTINEQKLQQQDLFAQFTF
jgi:hypothetical protein